MAEELAGRRVAALVAKGFEQQELLQPRDALTAAGTIVQEDLEAALKGHTLAKAGVMGRYERTR